MDPDATLRQIRALTSQVWLSIDEVRELSDLVKALDEWITKGGFLPKAWGTT